MRLLVVSQYFYPENFRINQLCLDLKNRGHTITVLTGKPNYPEGEYFEGYSYKGNEDEMWNEILIKRVSLRSRKSGSLNLIRNYLSFVWSASKRINLLQNDFDVIYVFGLSPITVALPAISFKKKYKVPIVMNIQDLWPESIVAVTGLDNMIINYFLDKLVNYIYMNCDILLCSSSSFVEKINKRVSNQTKVSYWPQYSLVERTDEINRKFESNKFNITFTGNLGEAQGLELAIYAAEKLKTTKIHWNFIGEGRNKERLKILVDELKLNNVISFHGYVNEREIPAYLSASNAALLILKPHPLFEMTIPAKLQTYLACGVPVICCVNGESKRIIKEAQCGVIAEEISVDSIVQCCRVMAESSEEQINIFKNNACEYSRSEFDKTKLLNELEVILNSLKGNKHD